MITSSFSTDFSIPTQTGERKIGPGYPVLIIAEAGVAHFGDMDLARQLVDMAADGGADIFKTQLFDVEALIAESARDWRDRLRSRNLTLDQAWELKERCENKGLIFTATAHDETRISWLQDLNVPLIKVGSGERNNTGFLTKLGQLGKPIILSTGMYGEADVHEAINACFNGGCRQMALLHCITSYPTPPQQVNLLTMDRLAEIFPGPVGYSDHTENHLAVLAAVARGAHIIEKHITILRDIPNAQDWKVSADPSTFPQLVRDIRETESLLGQSIITTSPCEEGALNWALKSLVATTQLVPGHVISDADLTAKRPGDGIPPNRISDVIGKTLKAHVNAGTTLHWNDLAS